MATEVIHSVDASGAGDYTTLEAWRDDQSRDLVTANELAVAEISGQVVVSDFDLSATAGTPWTVDTAHYAIIRPVAGQEYKGGTNPTAAEIYGPPGGYGPFHFGLDYTKVYDLKLRYNSGTHGRACIANTDNYTYERCLLRTDAGDNERVVDTLENTVFNSCVFVLTNSTNYLVNAYGYNNKYFINCVFVGGASVFYEGKAYYLTYQVVKNCVAYGQTDHSFPDWATLPLNAASTNNAAWDASTNSPPGSNPLLTDVTAADFADAANDDYHLSSGSILRGAGANLSADYPGMLDMDGDAFPSSGAWDIGADSYAAAAGADLAGAAQSAATASAALTTSIPLASAALAVSSAGGSLTTSIPLSGDGASVTIAGGTLSTSIMLSGDALAQAVAAAGLTTAIPLSGDAGAQAGATGELSAGAGLSGIAQAVASGAADLTVQIRLQGAALSEALASAGLTAPGSGLSGAAQAGAQASAGLTTEIPLQGAALSATDAAGGLTTEIPLSGAAASVTNAMGTLDVALSLSGDALALAVAAGTLATEIRLDGAALAQASASGQLTAGAYQAAPQERRLIVAEEARTWRVAVQNRTLIA